ncbi:hypothetical protein TNCV_2827301 [Trichonephila clavipes]|nr:hypothetical protein TNCV_2827301 [Trichonephila clavipes]
MNSGRSCVSAAFYGEFCVLPGLKARSTAVHPGSDDKMGMAQTSEKRKEKENWLQKGACLQLNLEGILASSDSEEECLRPDKLPAPIRHPQSGFGLDLRSQDAFIIFLSFIPQ